MVLDNPVIAKVLARYPDVAPSSLNFPADAVEWSEKDVDLFVGSGGFLKPKKKKPASAAAPAERDGSAAPGAAPADARAREDKKDANGRGEASAPYPSGTVPPKQPQPAAPAAAPQADGPPQQQSGTKDATGGSGAPQASAEQELPGEPLVPGPAVLPELPLTQWHRGEYWAPYATYMEDVGEKGLKLVSALNKCERFRNIGLKKGAGFTLGALKEKFGVGILLREFALEMTSQPPSDIMSLLWVSLRLELPCSPFMPMYQTMIPDGGNTPVCKGIFGMLMLNTSTMSVLEDNSIYEKVAEPLRRAFDLRRPTGAEGVPKFPRIYPQRGSPFRPRQLLRTSYTIMPSDCDMYRVIFHPQMVSVCEKVNFAVSAPFCDVPAVAIYANLAKPTGGDRFDVRVFVEPVDETAQFRVLYLFSSVSGSPTGAAAGAMAAFVVYGAPPGRLYSEDISACAVQAFAALEAFVARGAAKVDKALDLTRCEKPSA